MVERMVMGDDQMRKEQGKGFKPQVANVVEKKTDDGPTVKFALEIEEIDRLIEGEILRLAKEHPEKLAAILATSAETEAEAPSTTQH